VLPSRVALFDWLARGRRRVVELGTGTGWTALALALHDSRREVITYDPVYRTERDRYLELVESEVRRRITFVEAPGSSGPPDENKIDLLYVDSAHGSEGTKEELWGAWQPALAPGALVVLDDFSHPDFPGVREAVHELGLSGRQRGTLFVHEIASAAPPLPPPPAPSARPDTPV
jgi:predicted O-methyltransferase YrrM